MEKANNLDPAKYGHVKATQEEIVALNTWTPPAKYDAHPFGIGIELAERVQDARVLYELNVKAGFILRKEKRDALLERMGLYPKEAIARKFCLPGKSDDELRKAAEKLVKSARLTFYKDFPNLHFISLEQLYNLFTQMGHIIPEDKRPPEMARMMRRSTDAPRQETPPVTQQPPANLPRPVQDPHVAKLEKLRLAPHIDSQAIDILFPLLTLTPDERQPDHYEILQAIAALAMMLNRKNKGRQGELMKAMKVDGRGAGSFRVKSKIRHIDEAFGWMGEPSEDRVKHAAAAWGYLTLLMTHMIGELPEAQRKAILEMLKRGLTP